MLPPGPEFTITYPPWEFNEKMLKKLKLSIDKGGENEYNIPCSRELRLAEIEAWLSLVERCVRDAEAAGSNPVASTETKASELHLVLFCFWKYSDEECRSERGSVFSVFCMIRYRGAVRK